MVTFRPSCPASCSLVPGIPVFGAWATEDVDGRDKPGHDGECLDLSGGCVRE